MRSLVLNGGQLAQKGCDTVNIIIVNGDLSPPLLPLGTGTPLMWALESVLINEVPNFQGWNYTIHVCTGVCIILETLEAELPSIIVSGYIHAVLKLTLKSVLQGLRNPEKVA